MEKKINLVEIIPSLNIVAGGETLFTQLCKEFSCSYSEKISLTIIFFYEEKDSPLNAIINNLNCKVYFLNKKLGFDYSCAKKLKKLLKEINPDIIHTHLATSPTLFAAIKFNKKIPIVHTIHHMVGTGFMNDRFNMMLYKSKRIHLVCVSEESAISVYKKTHKKPIVIKNGINTNDYNPNIKIKDRSIDFLCVGTLSDVKNQIYLIECFKEIKKDIPNFNFVILGDGPNKENINNKIKEYKLTKNIKLKGFVSNVNEYMANSKILLISSTSEGNPMVINEALSSGMYIISNDVGGIKNIIQNNVNGSLIELDNKTSYINALKKFYNNSSFLEENRINQLNYINNYSIQNTASQYYNLFKDLLCKKNTKH